jgi:hypothetical protein
MVKALDGTRAARDRWLRERDDYATRLRATSKRAATIAASNDRLAAQVAMLEAQLAATESQREAATAQVAAFGDMLTVAWPIVRDMFMQVYLRLEPLMREAPAKGHTWDCARVGRPGACTPDCDGSAPADCCGEGWVTKGQRHNDGCPNA